MNYPFKENIELIDPQPIFTLFFKWFNLNVAPIDNQFMSITFLAIFIMIPITTLIIQEILFMYGMISWLAVVFSVFITFMDPQLYRIYTHATLAYSAIFPLVWYLLLKYQLTNKRKFLVFNFLLLLFVGFMNPYYTAISVLLALMLILFNNKLPNKLIIANVLLPLILYSIFSKILFGSNKTDMDPLPYGAFGQAYRCRPEDVFFPTEGVWNDLFNLQWIAHGSWEGTAFISWALWIPLVWFIYVFFTRIYKKKKMTSFNPFSSIVGLFIAAIILLVFSTGLLHFIFPEWLKLSFPSFIKNFRAYGRLSWIIFLFLSFFLSLKAFQLIRITRIKKQYFKKNMIIFAIVALYSIDVYDMNSRVMKHIEVKTWENMDLSIAELSKKINFDSFQAIIALPYFHCISGITEERGPLNGTMWPAFYLSSVSMLPITDNYSSRSSQSIARKQIQLFTKGRSGTCNYYPNKKPFLVVTNTEGKKRIEEGSTDKADIYQFEKQLFENCKLICSNKSYFIYSLDYNDFCQ
jgi:hypothetical protein